MKGCISVMLSLLFSVVNAAELPVEAFASAPTVDMLKLSPDGTKLSMIQTVDTEKSNWYW